MFLTGLRPPPFQRGCPQGGGFTKPRQATPISTKKNYLCNEKPATMNFYKDITPDYLTQEGINPKGLLFGRYHYPYNPRLKTFSRDLRNNGEKTEAMLWKRLKSNQIGFAFNRQRPILNFITDFYCQELGLVVEIDGASHFSAEAVEKDKERDRQMRVLGLEIIRVRDGDVRVDADAVARYIEEQCEAIRKSREAVAPDSF